MKQLVLAGAVVVAIGPALATGWPDVIDASRQAAPTERQAEPNSDTADEQS